MPDLNGRSYQSRAMRYVKKSYPAVILLEKIMIELSFLLSLITRSLKCFQNKILKALTLFTVPVRAHLVYWLNLHIVIEKERI